MQAVLAAQGPARKEGLGRQTSRQHRCRQHAGTQQKQQGEPSLTSVSEALPAGPQARGSPVSLDAALSRLSYVISGKSHTHASKPTVFAPPSLKYLFKTTHSSLQSLTLCYRTSVETAYNEQSVYTALFSCKKTKLPTMRI